MSSLDRRALLGTITHLALPVVLGNLAQTLMGLVDTLMVGRLGAAELAAVAVATLLFSALSSSIKALDVGVQSFTARRV
ncbi:MATE family efflux transporter, partial [bacterium]|nr:MATE family efflux transporter [bacterium]